MNNIFSISYIVVWWLVPVYLFLENKLSLIRREAKARWDGENVSVHWEQLRLCGIDQISAWHDALKGWGESRWWDVILQLDFRVGKPAERSRASWGAEKKKLQESSSTWAEFVKGEWAVFLCSVLNAVAVWLFQGSSWMFLIMLESRLMNIYIVQWKVGRNVLGSRDLRQYGHMVQKTLWFWSKATLIWVQCCVLQLHWINFSLLAGS